MRYSILLAALLPILLPSPASAEPLTFGQALDLARTRSRQLVAQGASATASREMGVAARQLPDPVLKFGISNLPVTGPDAFSTKAEPMTMGSVGVMQEFTRGDKLRARSARYEREAEVAEASKSLIIANLERDTAQAWLDRHYQEEIRELLLRQREEVRLQINAAEASYRAGRGAQADVFAARLAVAQLDDQIALADRQVATAMTVLSRWVGEAAQSPLAGMPDMSVVNMHVGQGSDADLDAQLAQHPGITFMAKQEALAKADVQVARANKQTDWSAEFMYNQRSSAYSNMVALNISIPLQWNQKDRQDRELSAKLAQAEQLRAEREEETRTRMAEVRSLQQAWQGNRDRLARYDANLIPLTAERTRAATTTYGTGGGSLAAVLDARRAQIDLQVERIKLEMETARLWSQLNFLLPTEHKPAIEAGSTP
ncbi:MAG TPA: TolC family protein [Rhodocyclaceae bacterium]|nr:TolC family protein [Rhodocyclaceae bacterium]